MADTKSSHASPMPVEGDGVSYSGIIWFVVVLTVVTVGCQLLMWGLFAFMQNQVESTDVVRSPVQPALVEPGIQDGRIVGSPERPQPSMLVDEPSVLLQFRQHEQELLTTYGWVDKNTGTVRIPIERAKQLLLERGLPTR